MTKITIEVKNPMGQMAKYESEDWLKVGEDIIAAESRRNPYGYSAVIRRFNRMIHSESWQRRTGLKTIVTLIGSVLGYDFNVIIETVNEET